MKSLASLFVTITLVVSPLTGCSKKEDTPPQNQQKALVASLTEDPLLKKIPDTTAGFLIMDLGGEGYTKFNASPWANDIHGLSAIQAAVTEMESQGATEEQLQLARTLLSSLQRLGLVSADGKSQVETIARSVVAFAGPGSAGDPLDFGIFVSAAKGSDLTTKASALKEILTENGMTTANQNFGSASGFAARAASDPENPAQQRALFVAATADKLGIGITEKTVAALFADANTSGLTNLTSLPEFAKAEGAVRAPEPQMSFAFLSMKKLQPVLEGMVEEAERSAVQSSPLAAVAVSQGFSSQMVTSAAFAVSPTNETQQKVLAAFENSGLPVSAFKIPADTALSLSLDARIIKKLEGLAGSLSDPSAAVVLQQLKDVEGMTLGIRGGEAASPIPDIYLAVESSSRDQVAAAVEGAVGLGMMATGQQVQWLSKDIAGAPTRYVMTPLGVGLYLSSPKNGKSLVIASSEKAIQDINTLGSGSQTALDSTMPSGLRQRVAASTAGSVYLNFIQIGNVLESVKSTLTSMVGPNPELEQALDPAQFRKFGIGIGSLSYANGVFRIQSAFERQPLTK